MARKVAVLVLVLVFVAGGIIYAQTNQNTEFPGITFTRGMFSKSYSPCHRNHSRHWGFASAMFGGHRMMHGWGW